MRKLFVLPFIMILAACAALGVPPANTFNKRVIVANSMIESTAKTVETLYSAGKINQAEAHNAHDHLIEAANGISLATSIARTNVGDANTRLDTIVIGLETLNAFLRSKQ